MFSRFRDFREYLSPVKLVERAVKADIRINAELTEHGVNAVDALNDPHDCVEALRDIRKGKHNDG